METKKNFEDDFTSLCDLLGEKSTKLFQEFGKPDDIDENADRSYVCFNSNHTHFGFNDSSIFVFQMPIADSFGHPFQTTDTYYNFKGLKLGMTKDEVISIWGQPKTEGLYRWGLGSIKNSFNKNIDIFINYSESEEDVYYLSSFEARLIEKDSQSTTTRTTQKSKGGCFIATACYGDYNAPEVLVLRHFRDNVLLNSSLGKIVVQIYYYLSPPLAKLIENSDTLKQFIMKRILTPIVSKINKK